jgi:hypothetical protein
MPGCSPLLPKQRGRRQTQWPLPALGLWFGVTLFASWIPARRGANVDPIAVLWSE